MTVWLDGISQQTEEALEASASPLFSIISCMWAGGEIAPDKHKLLHKVRITKAKSTDLGSFSTNS